MHYISLAGNFEQPGKLLNVNKASGNPLLKKINRRKPFMLYIRIAFKMGINATISTMFQYNYDRLNSCTGLLFLLFLFFGFVYSSTLLAKSYTLPVIKVEVDILSNGEVRITEHRTYRFEGSYSWADYKLPVSGFKRIKNIQVGEDGRAYLNVNKEEPGTFEVQRSDGQIRIKWFFNAEDELRTFTVSYELAGALVFGPDWSEFFWNYISDNRPKDTDSLFIALHLPRKPAVDSLQVWKRGPQSKISLTKTDRGYQVRAFNLDKNEFVKIRSVFPRILFNGPDVQTTDASFSLTAAQTDENQHREELLLQQELYERRAKWGKYLTAFIVILSFGVFIYLYKIYGQRYKPRIAKAHYPQIPGNLKPAAAGYLLFQTTSYTTLILATLMDLARRGYFIIKEHKPVKTLFGGKEPQFYIEKEQERPENDTLLNWEKMVVKYVDDKIEKEDGRLDKLFAGNTFNYFSASNWSDNWVEKLTEYCKAKNWYDSESKKGVILNIIIQGVLFALSILAAVWTGLVALIAILISLTFLFISFTISRRTPKGEKVYREWNSYRKLLKNTSDRIQRTNMLDKHLIYAVAFNFGEHDLEKIFSSSNISPTTLSWLVLYGGSAHSIAELGKAFATLTSTGASSFPGSTGGAGAVAGTAGGGASGGAG